MSEPGAASTIDDFRAAENYIDDRIREAGPSPWTAITCDLARLSIRVLIDIADSARKLVLNTDDIKLELRKQADRYEGIVNMIATADDSIQRVAMGVDGVSQEVRGLPRR